MNRTQAAPLTVLRFAQRSIRFRSPLGSEVTLTVSVARKSISRKHGLEVWGAGGLWGAKLGWKWLHFQVPIAPWAPALVMCGVLLVPFLSLRVAPLE